MEIGCFDCSVVCIEGVVLFYLRYICLLLKCNSESIFIVGFYIISCLF